MLYWEMRPQNTATYANSALEPVIINAPKTRARISTWATTAPSNVWETALVMWPL